jgi:pentatricopeptide repeat protein
MSLFGSLERSTSSPVLSTVACRPLLDFLCPASLKVPRPITTQRRQIYRLGLRNTTKGSQVESQAIDKVFIKALVHASSCQKHKPSNHILNCKSQFSSLSNGSRRRPAGSHEIRRSFRTDTNPQSAAQASAIEFTKDELNGLVDIYDSHVGYRRPIQRAAESRDNDITVVEDNRLIAIRNQPGVAPPPPRSRADMNTIIKIEKLLKNRNSSHEAIYDLYQSLPFPRVACLPGRTISALLAHFAVVEKRDEVSMLHYLSIVDDMKAANKPLTITEWTSAIAYAGRWLKKVTDAEVQSALYIFKEMESKAKVKGNFYTFNILYDIATKAGRFTLADAFLKEMERRHISLSRHFKTSRIYYYGCRMDGDGVRSAYRDLVESGHVVDTVVLNCVIAALIRAEEPVAAEHVFMRMKQLDQEKRTLSRPVRNWRERRKLGVTMSLAHIRRNSDPEQLEKLHITSSVAPDITTYRLLVGYHANDSGNIDRVTELLNEMTDSRLPLDGAVFFYLLRGFSLFGGVAYSAWSRSRLENTWASYKEALDKSSPGVQLRRGIVIVTLRAFGKCVGHQRVLEVWEEVRDRWKPNEEESRAVMDGLRDIIPADSEVFRHV